MKKNYKLTILFLIMLSLNIFQLKAQDKNICSKSKSSNHHKKVRASAFANALMNQYDVNYYFLTIEVENNSLFIKGHNEIHAKVVVSQLDTFCIELQANHTIDSIVYNGSSIPFVRTGDLGLALLPAPALLNSNMNMIIYYHGLAQNTIPGAADFGFNTAYDSVYNHNATWSLSQPYSAYDWFPCKQFLKDKADSSRVHIITSDSNKAGSNGILVGVDTLPSNKVMYKWFNKNPIDYYLISIAISEYTDYSYYSHLVSGDSVLIQNYIYDDSASISDFTLAYHQTDSMMRFLDSLLIPYPYKEQKYGHCVVPSSFSAMEHQTMSTVGSTLSYYEVIAHELAHQWFGDLVTCQTWNDIYLNEGITSFLEYLSIYQVDTAYGNGYMNYFHNSVMSMPGGSVYNPDTVNVSRIFDARLSYTKGAAFTHTMHYLLGDSLFYATLRTYLNTYKNSTASIPNFKSIAETVSGMNLTNFFNEWMYGEGYPTYKLKYNSTGAWVGVNVGHATSSLVTPLFTTPLELKLLSTAGDTIVKVNITSLSDTFWFPSTKIITGVQIDPNNWIINKQGVIQKKLDLLPTGIAPIHPSHSAEIWPNPILDGKINFYCVENKNAQIEIIDMTGKLILRTPFKNQIDISYLHSGIYLVKLFNNEGILKIQKITKP